MKVDLNKKANRCCFTGHRPEKLKRSVSEILRDLAEAIDAAISDGYTEFVTGMSRGVDMWAAEIVLERKQKNPEIKLLCIIPFMDFEKRWSKDWQREYLKIRDNADAVQYLYNSYAHKAYEARNQMMIDMSSRVIAVFNGTSGGTKSTLEYAGSQCTDIRLIHA